MGPAHRFVAAIEAARIAVEYRTPVILLTDGSLANGAEPWRLPPPDELPDIAVDFAAVAGAGPSPTPTWSTSTRSRRTRARC